ncbi:MAG: Fe-S cluster assembly sulfur transfer protein SufU [Bdellovibrionota bacterium]
MSENNSSETLSQLYQEVIREHHKDPRHYGTLSSPDAHAEGYNPLCGDKVIVELKLSKQAPSVLEDICFRGEGCSICMASASMMAEEVQGKNLEEAEKAIADFRGLMQGTLNPEVIEGDIRALAGVRRFPVRIKCALLPWMTLKNAVEGRAGVPANTEKGE